MEYSRVLSSRVCESLNRPLRGEPCGDTVGLEWREEMVETVSSEGLLGFHSSEEFTGGFLTTWGELESTGKEENWLFLCRRFKARNENNSYVQLYALGVPVSLALLFFRRGFRGTCT